MNHFHGYNKVSLVKSPEYIAPLYLTILLALVLHQSYEMLGVNISFADSICLFMLLYFVHVNQFKLTKTHLLFFQVLSVSLIVTAAIYIPTITNYIPDLEKIFINYLKVIVLFLYFLIGFNLAKGKNLDEFLKWYTIGGLLIGSIGMAFTLFNIGIFREILYFERIRYRGLMNDPNYFAILQVTILPYSSYIRDVKLRRITWLVVAMSVLVSGSKTGLITFIAYLTFRILGITMKNKLKLQHSIVHISSIVITLLILFFLSGSIGKVLIELQRFIPPLVRINEMFINFTEAFSGDGSGRDTAWVNAYELIQLSPLLGVGVGTYSGLANQLFGSGIIAHNTYFQLAVEWGLPLSIIFFFYVFYLLYKTTFINHSIHKNELILRDIVVILLIGSVGISLNNSRVFWICLGALVSKVYLRKNNKYNE
jgi:hypothetical protein